MSHVWGWYHLFVKTQTWSITAYEFGKVKGVRQRRRAREREGVSWRDVGEKREGNGDRVPQTILVPTATKHWLDAKLINGKGITFRFGVGCICGRVSLCRSLSLSLSQLSVELGVIWQEIYIVEKKREKYVFNDNLDWNNRYCDQNASIWRGTHLREKATVETLR